MNNIVEQGKTNAIISYLTIIGTVVAVLLNNGKKNSFTSFHIRQNIGLNIIYFLNQWIVYKYFGLIAFWIIGALCFFMWISGFLGVMNNEKRLLPIFGDKFQQWFKNLQ